MATGYGKETWCYDSVQPGRYATKKQALAQACYRRLITPRGTLRGAELDSATTNYGFDLIGYVGAVSSAFATAAIPALVANELQKDDRVVSATVVVYVDGESLVVSIDVEAVEDWQDFTLTVVTGGDILAVRGLT